MLLTVFTTFLLVHFEPDSVTTWWNYPGLELWKFLNLMVFIGCALYLHRRFGRPIREALRSRSEAIKRELQRAREERDLALAKLAEVEKRFEGIDAEVAKVKDKASAEVAAERDRMRASTAQEIAKIREQAKREIEGAGKTARNDLRKFAAQQSVLLAEEILEREIAPADDARLTRLSIEELGRSRT